MIILLNSFRVFAILFMIALEWLTCVMIAQVVKLIIRTVQDNIDYVKRGAKADIKELIRCIGIFISMSISVLAMLFTQIHLAMYLFATIL